MKAEERRKVREQGKKEGPSRLVPLEGKTWGRAGLGGRGSCRAAKPTDARSWTMIPIVPARREPRPPTPRSSMDVTLGRRAPMHCLLPHSALLFLSVLIRV